MLDDGRNCVLRLVAGLCLAGWVGTVDSERPAHVLSDDNLSNEELVEAIEAAGFDSSTAARSDSKLTASDGKLDLAKEFAGERLVDDELRVLIDGLGFDSSTAVRTGNLVSVEGDVLLFRDLLLEGEYEPRADFHGDAVVEKGYRRSSIINTSNSSNIKLTASADAVNTSGVSLGALFAAAQWSTDSSIDISPANTGATIHIEMRDDAWMDFLCGESCLGLGAYPSDGKPGTTILLRRTTLKWEDAGWECSWNVQIAAYVLGHEMGHTLGMTHPGNGSWIPGTSSCDLWTLFGGSPAWCLDPGIAPYDTIMHPWPWQINASCGVPDPLLGQDDLLAVSLLYPE